MDRPFSFVEIPLGRTSKLDMFTSQENQTRVGFNGNYKSRVSCAYLPSTPCRRHARWSVGIDVLRARLNLVGGGSDASMFCVRKDGSCIDMVLAFHPADRPPHGEIDDFLLFLLRFGVCI